jgi:UDP-2-acetamido-3-amino-2,3-dideoxy-glucuronate N-acetyltransferase
VVGNPARIVGYVDSGSPRTDVPSGALALAEPKQAGVRGVVLHEFPVFSDMRGSLSVGEFEKQVPFMPARFFLVYAVPSQEVRGEHAHRVCQQFLICVRGSCRVMADDGTHRAEWNLDRAQLGLYLPAMTWGVQYRYSSDALLLVFASHAYDSSDYIRNYDEFLKLARRAG